MLIIFLSRKQTLSGLLESWDYSFRPRMQGHFRTTVKNTGQVEIDDLYIGLDTDGNGFVLPIEAKIDSLKDQLGVVQVTQMIRFAEAQFPDLSVRPIGVKLMLDGSYMFLEFTAVSDPNQIATKRYKRYLLVREP